MTTTYFDLHTVGIGYLNRLREVAVKRGQNFLAVDISALRGATDQVEYTRFDCRVYGETAQAVLRELWPRLATGQRILVGFKIGDIYAEPFVYQSGAKAGQTGISLKGRLLRITWAKVDGAMVYRAPETETSVADPRPETNAQDCAAYDTEEEDWPAVA